jgi:hypothetical protein
MATTPAIGAKHGAPLLPPVLAYAVVSILAAILPLAIAGRASWTSDQALLDVYRHHQNAVHLQALLTTSAAVPLAVLTAIFSHRIDQLGLTVPGRLIALAGGSIAATLLAISGLITLSAAASHASDDVALLRFAQHLAIALDGTGFAVFSGLLIAGISVTGLLGRLLPAPVAASGLVLAFICELAVLTTLTSDLDVLLPIARFGGIIWLVAAALTLKSDSRPGPPVSANQPQRSEDD